MGDFAAPACSSTGVPKHSTVVERLRQRIEGCRRHHAACESRYQQAQAEQLELERRDTVSLYQRSLEQRARKGQGKQQGKQQQQPEPEVGATAEQRTSTLIALQETVKRKLDSARSPLNGEQNGICDGNFSPNSKRLRKEGSSGGMDLLAGLTNSAPPLPSVSPIHQIDIKPQITLGPSTNSSIHVSNRVDDLGKNGLPELKLNGSLDLDESFGLLQSKDLKQEPLDDPTGIESSDTSLSNQNKLFSDINLNDQEWQELIDELANTVSQDDMHDLFNEDFEEKKETDFSRSVAQAPLSQEPSAISSSQNNQIPIGSPQVPPASSGPQFSTTSNGTPPQQALQQPAVALVSGSAANGVTQSPTQAQTQPSRHGNGFLMNSAPGVLSGSTPGLSGTPGQGGNASFPLPQSTPDLTPAEQLKQMAAQRRANLSQQKHQQQQQSSQTANWSPVGAPSSPFGGPFNPDKPNSPMMYPQTFNTQNPMAPAMANNPQKANMNTYLPQNHINMIGQQPNNAMSKQQSGMLSYNNTKPLTHFAVDHMGQRMTPPVSNPTKNPMMPYMQPQAGQGAGQAQVAQQAPGQMSGQVVHLTEEHKRMMLMKPKVMSQSMSYSGMPHGQEQNLGVGMTRQAGGGGSTVPSTATPGASQGAPSYLDNPQQAAMVKQMQEKRVQMHLMEQQKRQQLQRQQQQMLAEQMQQPQQHLPRQLPQQQRHPYPVQQVAQFQGTQELAARNQALQNIRHARALQHQQQQQQQNPGMLQMSPLQMGGGTPTSDMTVAYASQGGGQPAMYALGPTVNPMMHPSPNQSAIGVAQPRASMVGGYGQGVVMNSTISQQQMKSQAVPKGPVQRFVGSGSGQAVPGWQQQQALSGRTSSEMAPFNSNQTFAIQSGQPRMSKPHFPQSINQSMVDPRTINPGQMLPHMAAQTRTNPPRPVMMPTVSGFNQGSTLSMGGTVGGAYVQGNQSQGYQRTPSQDMSYGYSGGGQSGAGAAFSLSDTTDLDTTDGWMEEFLSSQ